MYSKRMNYKAICFFILSNTCSLNIKQYKYQIKSIEGPRADEIKQYLLNQPSSPFIIEIKYNVTDYQLTPNIHVTYTITTPINSYTYHCVVKTSNQPLPWQTHCSFPKTTAFYINKHIQKSIHFIQKKEQLIMKTIEKNDESNQTNS